MISQRVFKYGLVLGFFLMINFDSFSQRSCGTQILHQEKMKNDVEYAKNYIALEKALQKKISQNGLAKANCSTPFFFPVAVHYDWVPSAADQAKLITLAQNQIATLNSAFNGTDCQGTSNNNCYEFFLAVNDHPAGSGLTAGQPAVTFGGTAGADYCATGGTGMTEPCNLTNWVGYMNITVNNLATTMLSCSDLGVSHLAGNPTTMNSMSVNSCAFGSNGVVTGVAEVQDAMSANKCDCLEATVNGGTTVVHEIGHFLNLLHTFCEDMPDNGANGTSPMAFVGSGPCVDLASCDCDMVGDTPAQAFSNNGCPGGSSTGMINNPTTGMNHDFRNFMDYVNDSCMNCFSQGQYTRANAQASSTSGYKTKAAVTLAPTAANIPTMGEWGLIVLSIFLMIIGVIAVTQPRHSTL